jgi:hypothetical protein
MWALIPETIGKDLEAVDELLRTEVSRESGSRSYGDVMNGEADPVVQLSPCT